MSCISGNSAQSASSMASDVKGIYSFSAITKGTVRYVFVVVYVQSFKHVAVSVVLSLWIIAATSNATMDVQVIEAICFFVRVTCMLLYFFRKMWLRV